ncbi:hypothetical protein EBT31_20175, partial [bacterium]|nr:hypothetical protein [bacterium]
MKPVLQPVRSDVMKLGGTATLQEEADEEGFMSKVTNLWSALTSNEHLPKKFRQFIKAHGRDKIQSLSMMRAPVQKPGVLAMQLLTLGKWDEFKKRAGVDEVYHTSLIVNGNIVLEKLEKLEGRVDAGYAKMPGAELFAVDIPANTITIAEFLEKGRRQMGTAFYTYDAFKNNCQNWVANMVSANGLLTAEGRTFIKQDIDKLIKELPALTKYGAEKITDVARDVGNVAEEILYKRGGHVMGQRTMARGRGRF